MWIVKLALRNPYSIAVLAIVIFILGILSIKTMLVDIFPLVNLPVVGVVWNYPGLSAEDMESRIVTITERAFSTTVSGISRIESQSILGIGTLRVYFQPDTDIGGAIAQISATCETILRVAPPGITPPAIFPFNASNVPVAQLSVFSDTLGETELFDYALNFIRVQLFTIPGLATPAPYGGLQRQINVDVDPERAAAKGISPQDVANALQQQNIIIPAGDARMGTIDYDVLMNASPQQVSEFSKFPVKVVGGRPVTMNEIGKVYDGFADQTNIVRLNAKRATYLSILKKANASTLDVVNAAKKAIPRILATAPKGMKLRMDFDQSIFVRASVTGVIREACIAALLVSLMILLFLGSLRSVIIVTTSIPLSILVGLIGLKLTGQTINIMTLGGLSLAIGMLVDDATVEIENINRNIPLSDSTTIAILRGAKQIALPAIVSTLAICIVFFPVVLLTGPAKFLFTPLAEAVVFSMLASYVLSRTLVPILARKLLHEHPSGKVRQNSRKSFGERYREWTERLIDRMHHRYAILLRVLLAHRTFTLVAFALLFAISVLLPFMIIGTDFFPTTDAGILKLHFRAPSGTRIEVTEQLVAQAEDRIRQIIPGSELQTINSNLGIPLYYNLAFVPSDNVGPMDAEILIALKPEHHPTAEYARKIRDDLTASFPGSAIYFQSADIVNQVLNFGLTSPIDVQIESRDISKSYEVARNLRDQMKLVPGVADVIIKQVFDYPALKVNVDRVRAAEVGLTEKDVASSMLFALASGNLVAPSYYVNPSNGVNYNVVVKEPLSQLKSVHDLSATPVTPLASLVQPPQSPLDVAAPPPSPSQRLTNVSSIDTQTTVNQVTHENVQRVVDITASPEGRDLGGVVADIQKRIDGLGKLPPGMKVTVLGQNQVMHESFSKLGLGMILAIALVYLLMVILFQSWLDPFIIMVAVPGALIGVLWMLAISGTTINVVSLMGSIMAVGIAVSNSNLMVTFANEIRVEREMGVEEAAVEAGVTRLRPVIMTALAMILGMVPMSLGLGEGGEQNAPLGKAVIGGLLVATFVTLFIVPLLYAVLRRQLPSKFVLQEHYHREERKFEEDETHVRKVAC